MQEHPSGYRRPASVSVCTCVRKKTRPAQGVSQRWAAIEQLIVDAGNSGHQWRWISERFFTHHQRPAGRLTFGPRRDYCCWSLGKDSAIARADSFTPLWKSIWSTASLSGYLRFLENLTRSTLTPRLNSSKLQLKPTGWLAFCFSSVSATTIRCACLCRSWMNLKAQ